MYYNGANPKRFKVYGSVNPNPNGSWDSWELLGEFESVKPSGTALGTVTSADVAKAEEGEEYTFDINSPPLRYLRFQTTETWGNAQNVYISEMAFWGGRVN